MTLLHHNMKNNPFIHIVIPAYNEESLIGTSVETLDEYLRTSGFPYPYNITVVSNASTDRTDDIVRSLARERSTVTLLALKKKGKGLAIREGWKGAGDILAFMDADLSSDLKSFKNLIDVIVRGDAAVASGNRLGKNSRIEGRRFTREFVSRAYNFIVRILFTSSLDDHQCGFKAIRRDAYESIAPKLKSNSWFFDTELLILARSHGYAIHAEDIYWNDYRKSKVSLFSTSWEMLCALLAFRDRLCTIEQKPDLRCNLFQVVKFLMSGTSAAMVNLVLFFILFTLLQVHYLNAVIGASLAAFITSFVLQKFWTFRITDARGRFMRHIARYTLSAISTVLMNLVIIYVLVQWVRLPPLVAQFLSLATIAIINFFIYKFIVFIR